MSTYGYECYNHDQCKEEIKAPTQAQVEQEAFEAGWVIGLDQTGQAYYSCAGCGPGLFATHPLRPL